MGIKERLIDLELQVKYGVDAKTIEAERKKLKENREAQEKSEKKILKKQTRKFFKIASLICVLIFSYMVYLYHNPYNPYEVIKHFILSILTIGIFVSLLFHSKKSEIITLVLIALVVLVVYGSMIIF